MPTRLSLERDDALSRRLAQLGEELSRVRPARAEPPATDLTTAPWWDDHTRPAAPRRPAPSPPARPPARRPTQRPSPLPPVPGRHAGPRPWGLGGLGVAQLAVVAVVVAVGVAVTCWWL